MVQVICTVISAEKDIDPDIAAMIGTSAALSISGIPFNGPLVLPEWVIPIRGLSSKSDLY